MDAWREGVVQRLIRYGSVPLSSAFVGERQERRRCVAMPHFERRRSLADNVSEFVVLKEIPVFIDWKGNP